MCDNERMSKSKRPATLTATLRRTIIESKTPMLALAKATGVERMSIVRFTNGERSIYLDAADKLAEHFGLELRRKG